MRIFPLTYISGCAIITIGQPPDFWPDRGFPPFAWSGQFFISSWPPLLPHPRQRQPPPELFLGHVVALVVRLLVVVCHLRAAPHAQEVVPHCQQRCAPPEVAEKDFSPLAWSSVRQRPATCPWSGEGPDCHYRCRGYLVPSPPSVYGRNMHTQRASERDVSVSVLFLPCLQLGGCHCLLHLPTLSAGKNGLRSGLR